MIQIVGRKNESEELLRIFHRNEAQLVAVYGRRRVGKTFLVRELLGEHFVFYHTGVSPVELQGDTLLDIQLKEFASSLRRSGMTVKGRPADWTEAFDLLRELLDGRPKGRRMVVFIDEMPWMDTPRGGFITAFEHFWNNYGSGNHDLMMIVCGSASSWIKDNLIDSPGGFYDRVNCEIQLSPFSLGEAEQLLFQNGVSLSRYEIAQLYMVTGGVPMYLTYTTPGLSSAQNIDRLFFNRKAKLRDEFEHLFNSTFSNPERTKSLIRLLAGRHSGYSRDDISKHTKLQGKDLSKLLRSLEAGDFIARYQPFGNTKRQLMYRLIDPFCLFWISQVDGKNRGDNFWQEQSTRSSVNAWRGIAFEELCMSHIPQIKSALGISGTPSTESAWTLKGTDEENSNGNVKVNENVNVNVNGAQIDLIIRRRDNIVNICEMKFYEGDYSVSADEERKLLHRRAVVSQRLMKRESPQMTLVTTFSLKPGLHSTVFSKTVTLDNLFL